MKAGDERETPQWFFDLLDSRFGFTLDVAASDTNYKCEHYYTKTTNGLKQSWHGQRCFMNPPWSDLLTWCEKAEKEARFGALVVGVVPHDTSTHWWNWHCEFNGLVWLPRKRIHFPVPGNPKGSPRFPIAVVIWHGMPAGDALQEFKEYRDYEKNQDAIRRRIRERLDSRKAEKAAAR